MTEIFVCSKKLCVRDEETPTNPELTPHPICVMSQFVRLRQMGETVEKARNKAREICLAMGLYHGVSKLAKKAKELGF